MKYGNLFSVIDSLYDHYVNIWAEVSAIESPTRHKAGVDAVGRYLAAIAEKHGWQVEFGRQETAGDTVCITMNADVDAAPVSLSGHMDTVHACGSFGTPPVRLDDEKIYGPGVTDCKGGLVAALMAMDALERCGYRERPVQLLLQSDEEMNLSSKTTIAWICEKAKHAVAFLNLEPHSPGQIVLMRKGIATFTFTVQGEEAHASLCAQYGANAIAEAAHKIIELETWKDPDGLTCNCGVIRGGTVVNTVPGLCEFKANVRFATQQQLEWAKAEMQRIADRVYVTGCKTTVEMTGFRVAMEYARRNEELAENINRLLAEHGMPVLTPYRRSGGSDAADVTVYGIPCVDSLGTTGGRIHSPQEYGELSSLTEAARRLALIVSGL